MRKGFAMTLIELLVVMAVIIILLSVVIVAVQAATRTAQGANTRFLMTSIKQALVRFKEDIGYYPPVLGPADDSGSPVTSVDLLRQLDPPPDPAVLPEAEYRTQIQDWYSTTSLPEYLIGYGHHRQDGYGFMSTAQGGPLYDDENPPLGIRHPGPDGVWGATIEGSQEGLLVDRMSSATNPHLDTGKVFGPYLELKDDRMTTGVFLVGQQPDRSNDPKVILDYWGQPIRYYRRVYAGGSLSSSYRSYDPNIPTPTLSDVYVLRPFEINEGAAIDGIPDLSDGAGNLPDSSTTAVLNAAEFALFSPGPDRASDSNVRRDIAEHNKDNIVELGP